MAGVGTRVRKKVQRAQVQRPVVAAAGPRRVAASLRVSSAHDASEREAGEVARRVVEAREPAAAAQLQGGQPPSPSRAVRPVSRQLAREREPATGPEGGVLAPELAAEIEAARGGGAPLPDGARRFMEPRFGVDFGAVRVHTDQRSQGLNARLGARAFTVGRHVFFGRGQFEPESRGGRELLAHELTHTIQQGAVAAPGREAGVVRRAPQGVQLLGLGDALAYLARQANLLPGFRLLTLALGVNPIDMSPVQRTTANLLRAVIEVLPGATLITQMLDNHGLFARAGAWIDERIQTSGVSAAAIRAGVGAFLDSLSWSDIFSLGDVWERGKRLIGEPISRLLRFVGALLSGLLQFVREALLTPLAALAAKTRGYPLLTALLGRDPLTGVPVPRTAETLVGGFMTLIGREDVWENIQRAKAVPRAWAWFVKASTALTGFVLELPGRLLAAVRALGLADLVVLPLAFAKLALSLGGFVARFVTWAAGAVLDLMTLVIDALAPGLMVYLRKAGKAFRTILADPVAFVRHLVGAARMGFRNFATNIVGHLKAGVISWLTGSLGDTGVHIPKAFTLRELAAFVLSVLGVSWQSIRAKLVKAVGERAVAAMETTVEIVTAVVTRGPMALWERLRDFVGDLKDTVMAGLKRFVMTRVVQAAVARIVRLLAPAGAVIEAVLAIYNTVMFFIERAKQIARTVAVFIDSLATIAAGVIKPAAAKVEATLAKGLGLAISFLARFLGLGKVSDAVLGILDKLRAPVDKAIDKVVAWLVGLVGKGVGAVTRGVRGAFDWLRAKVAFRTGDGEQHSVYVEDGEAGPRLMVASTPTPAARFLDWLLAERERVSGAPLAASDQARVTEARQAIAASETTVAAIAEARRRQAPDADVEALQRRLLKQNTAVTNALAALGAGLAITDGRRGTIPELYDAEGLTGTYASMPKITRDDLTADHQPANSIFQAAVGLMTPSEADPMKEEPLFSENGAMAARAKGRSRRGFAINLHVKRHMAGRTFGGNATKLKNAFLNDVRPKVASPGVGHAAKRSLVVGRIKWELGQDVGWMKSLAANRTGDRELWSDVWALKGSADGQAGQRGAGLTDEAIGRLIGQVAERIRVGEDQLAAQDLDVLAS